MYLVEAEDPFRAFIEEEMDFDDILIWRRCLSLFQWRVDEIEAATRFSRLEN